MRSRPNVDTYFAVVSALASAPFPFAAPRPLQLPSTYPGRHNRAGKTRGRILYFLASELCIMSLDAGSVATQ